MLKANYFYLMAGSMVFIAGVCFAPRASSAADSDTQDHMRLITEIERLKSQNERLQFQNKHLQAEVSVLRKPTEPNPKRAQSQIANPQSAPIADNTAPNSKPPSAKVAESTLLLRSNYLEASQILFHQQTDSAKGASFAWTDDYVAKTKTLTIQSYLSWHSPELRKELPQPPPPYRLNTSYFASYAIAPFVYLNGKYAEPFKSTERSAAQAGLNSEFRFLGGSPFSETVVSALPYVQTDFRGRGRIYGLDFLAEPYQPDWFLGGTHATAFTPVIDAYWRLIGEENLVHVAANGLSNFAPNTTYALSGGTVQFRGLLFEDTAGVPKELCGRVSLLASYQYFWDAMSGARLNNLHGEVDYDLTAKAGPITYACGGTAPATPASPAPTSPPFQAPQTALAVTYDAGTDKSTMAYARKFGVSLTLLY